VSESAVSAKRGWG